LDTGSDIALILPENPQHLLVLLRGKLLVRQVEFSRFLGQLTHLKRLLMRGKGNAVLLNLLQLRIVTKQIQRFRSLRSARQYDTSVKWHRLSG
jgi:hypothetical protein